MTKVNPATATYQFQTIGSNSVANWKNYYSNLDFLAKHFMVKSMINSSLKVARHYTVCHSMVPEFKADLIKLVDDHIAGNNDGIEKFKQTHMHDRDEDKICLTIKNYLKPKGLSTKIGAIGETIKGDKETPVQAAVNDTFVVKGPCGQGLRIDKTGGAHVVFAAGTGVLCFLDIVAHLMLKNLGIISGPQVVGDDFNLHFYVAYRSRGDSMGVDLIEACERLMEHKPGQIKAKFIKVDRSNKGPGNGRWDARFIEGAVKSISAEDQIKRMWVCGPPAMGQLFDITLDKIGAQYNLNSESLIVL